MIVDTIAAPATPPGRGGVGIIRISGPLVKNIAQTILKQLPAPRYASYQAFYATDNSIIDCGIALYFPAPNSYTGEDVLELQAHGGPIILDMLLQRAIALGARLAQPGEFTERAFLNDKLDLAQAEAVADLINATSRQAAQSAQRSLQGEFSQQVHQLVTALIHLRMYVEAAIDFPEEEIDFLSDGKVSRELQTIIQDLQELVKQANQGALLREGITVVIAGRPNAGKSSLLNQLSGQETAIVTEIPGTTRDILREQIQIDGLPLHIIDTAGLRPTEDQIEQEGIRRAWREIEHADHILLVMDATQNNNLDLKDLWPELSEKKISAEKITVVRNKIDLLQENPKEIATEDCTIISLSAKVGQGIDLLREHLKKCVGYRSTTESTFTARRRHLEALHQAENYLLEGQQELLKNNAGELLAQQLYLAQQALNEITGEFRSDDLLGKIFSSFCIGK